MSQFKGIWVPLWILELEDIKPVEMLLLAEIENLAQGEKGCTAHNEHFASRLRCSVAYVSRMITKLCQQGYLRRNIRYKKGTKQVEERNLYPFTGVNTPFTIVNTPFTGVNTPFTIVQGENKDENKREINKKEEEEAPALDSINDSVSEYRETQKEEYLSRLEADYTIIEEVARRQKMKKEDVMEVARNFATDKILTDDWKYPTYKDFRNHFYNWQRYQKNLSSYANQSERVQPRTNRPAKKEAIDIYAASSWIR